MSRPPMYMYSSELINTTGTPVELAWIYYRQVSNIRRTLVVN